MELGRPDGTGKVRLVQWRRWRHQAPAEPMGETEEEAGGAIEMCF